MGEDHTCYHPLFVFNQFGDLERCALRPGNVHSADGWQDLLEPVVVRYRGKFKTTTQRLGLPLTSSGNRRPDGPKPPMHQQSCWTTQVGLIMCKSVPEIDEVEVDDELTIRYAQHA